MSSNSYNAQGATLKIGATGTVKTITGISKANPAVVTATAHGFTDGAVIKISAVAGMTEINGKVGVVLVVDANNFKLAGVDSTAFTTYTSAGSATPSQVQLTNFKSWNGFGGQASDIDVTDLDSQAKEYRAGLKDNGELSIDVLVIDTDDGQNAMRANMAASGPTSPFLLTFANGKSRSFSGYVKAAPEQGGVDTVITGSFTIKISGTVVRA